MQKPDFIFELAVIDLPHVLFCEYDFSSCSIREQIYSINRPISRDQIIKVSVECPFSELGAAGESYIFCDAFLLPEDRNRPSDDCITENDVVYLHNLLGFYKVCNISCVVYTSSMKSSTSAHVASPGYQT